MYDYKDIKFGERLGEGRFGFVYKGTVKGNLKVAIKSITVGNSDLKKIIKEIIALKIISHENIVSVRGYSVQLPKTVYLLLERVDGRDLESIIFIEYFEKEYNLSLCDKHSIAYDICCAINYLHTHPSKFVHCDVKPANIIINQKTKKAMLCDFGLVKIRSNVDSILATTDGKPILIGTWPYMAPEVHRLERIPDTYSDVWSSVITLIELYSFRQAFEYNIETVQLDMRKHYVSQEIPNLDDVPSILQGIFEDCLKYDPESRPTMENLMSVFTEHILPRISGRDSNAIQSIYN